MRASTARSNASTDVRHFSATSREQENYQSYGAVESSYRPGRWGSFREPYKFTGKEEDIEVGLVYFGFRYLNPLLQRWISADPLAIHDPGKADLNVYAYVGGRVLVLVDPLGLEGVPSFWGQAASAVGCAVTFGCGTANAPTKVDDAYQRPRVPQQTGEEFGGELVLAAVPLPRVVTRILANKVAIRQMTAIGAKLGVRTALRIAKHLEGIDRIAPGLAQEMKVLAGELGVGMKKQVDALARAGQAITEHLKPADITGAIAEEHGIALVNRTTKLNHRQKVDDAVGSLRHAATRLEQGAQDIATKIKHGKLAGDHAKMARETAMRMNRTARRLRDHSGQVDRAREAARN